MKRIAIFFVWSSLFASGFVTERSNAQTPPAVKQSVVNQSATRSIGKIEAFTDQMKSKVSMDAKIEVLAGGFTWTEGPLWVPTDHGPANQESGGKRAQRPSHSASGYLLFSDIPRNTIFRWDETHGVIEYMRPSGYTGVAYYGLEPGSNGLTLDPQGRLCMCEHGDRRISVLTHRGGKQTIVDSYQGRRLNSPNDLVFASDGTLYFTDPPYGLPDRADDERRELDFCGVYRRSTSGELTLLTKTIDRPNGIGLSPDGKTLIVAQSDPDAPIWTTFAIQPDGTVSEGRVIADAKSYMKQFAGLPDGLCVTRDGTIFASGPGGVYVMDFGGTIHGRITTARKTSNCTLSPDEATLYITADDIVCRVRLK